MKLIDYDAYEFSNKEKREYIFAASILISVTLYLFYKTVIVISLSVILAAISLKIYEMYKVKKRKELLVLQFRDLLYSFSASVGAGRHMAEALYEAERNLLVLYDSDTPMIKELQIMNKRISELHEDEEMLLKDLGKRSGIKDITVFADVYYICRNTGGDLVKVIGITSQILIDKLTILRDIESYTAQKKFEGRVIALLTPAIILFLNIISPGYLQPLYDGAGGRIIMTVTLMLVIIGYVISEKITEVGIWNEKGSSSFKKQFRRNKEKKRKEESAAKCNNRTSRFYKSACASFKCRTCAYDSNRKDSE